MAASHARFGTYLPVTIKSTFSVITALLLAASMWFYVDRILVPYQISDAVAHDRPRGNLSDLYPRWLGARELLHGRDPYSLEVTRDIQRGYYGRVLDGSRPGDPQDRQGFAYPVYVVFLLAPTIYLPFNAVQLGFYVLLWVLTGASVLLWLHGLRWNPKLPTKAVLVILTLGSVPAVQGLKLQQLSLVVAALLAGAIAAVTSGYLILGGVLLALASIKPQLAWLSVLWLGGWAVRDWRQRQRLVWSFGAVMSALLIGAEIILPGWIGKFRTAVADYHQYTHNMSVLGWLLTPFIGGIMALLLTIGTAIWCWRRLDARADATDFALMASMVMALTTLVVPMFAPYNQVLLIPALLLLFRNASQLRQGSRISRMLLYITAGFLLWPWLAVLSLMIASAILPATTVQRAWTLPLYTSFGLPLAVFALLGSYATMVPRSQKIFAPAVQSQQTK